MLNIVIIADDLTGANDTGVQLVRKGIRTAVQIDYRYPPLCSYEALVFDTDSRSDEPKTAYRKVLQLCESVRKAGAKTIYKKIDSTLRGNIGAELDAIFDVFNPDFVVIAPSFPSNGRTVVDGHLFVNGVPLHNTDIAKDPKTPVTESSLLSLLAKQATRKVAHITINKLYEGLDYFKRWIDKKKKAQVPYLVFDAKTDEDLSMIVRMFHQLNYNVIWCGSAGLANALANAIISERFQSHFYLDSVGRGTIMTVVGSVNSQSRKQLQLLLKKPEIAGIEWNVSRSLESSESMQQIVDHMLDHIVTAHRHHQHIVLYSSGSSKDVVRAHRIGHQMGKDARDVSVFISRTLGLITAKAVEACDLRHLIVTGGDTAKQVCLSLGANELELIDEIESGIPLCRIGNKYMITKAGGFGNDGTLVRLMQFFKGGMNS